MMNMAINPFDWIIVNEQAVREFVADNRAVDLWLFKSQFGLSERDAINCMAMSALWGCGHFYMVQDRDCIALFIKPSQLRSCALGGIFSGYVLSHQELQMVSHAPNEYIVLSDS